VKSPKRILILVGSMGAGGTEKQVLEILRRLDRTLFLPHLYLIYRQGEWLARIPEDVPVAAYWNDERSRGRYFPGRILLSQARDVRRWMARWQIDLLYDRNSQMTLTAYLAGRPRTVARVSVAAGDPQREFLAAHRTYRTFKYWLLHRAYRNADRVFAVCEEVRRDLIRFYRLPEEKVETHYNVFDAAELRAQSQQASPRQNRDGFQIVSVGRLQSEKGHQVLLQAVAWLLEQAPALPVRVWLLGTGPAERELRQYVQQRQLEPYVEFLGFQPNPLPWVREADLFCLPSWYEGMPNALVEAMLLGTPIVATDCPGGVREVLDGGRWGILVPPGDSTALARAIAEVRANLPQAKQRAEQAQSWAEARFDAAATMQRLQEAFLRAIYTRQATSNVARS
jgi:glycosyltransferase involved in cell wall biosynthesis